MRPAGCICRWISFDAVKVDPKCPATEHGVSSSTLHRVVDSQRVAMPYQPAGSVPWKQRFRDWHASRLQELQYPLTLSQELIDKRERWLATQPDQVS